METDMIKITHLKKSFGDVKAVNDLSFQVKKGELFAFLGVNGAGKSTTISIICGQLRKDSGTVQIQGTDLDKIGRKVGTMLGVVVSGQCAGQATYRQGKSEKQSSALWNNRKSV